MQGIKKYLMFSLMSLSLPTFLSSCSNNDNFYLSNYESYISQDLLNTLESNESSSKLFLNNKETNILINNFNYRTYSTNEDLERNFVTNYDVAIPSTYLAAKLANRGELEVIDWSKFDLYQLNQFGNKTDKKIENAEDALTLFTNHARQELLAYDLTQAFEISRQEGKTIYENAGLLNYCAPYFIQDVILGYNSQNVWNTGSDDNLDWNQIMNLLYQNIDNQTIKRVATVDDFSTLYPIARLIQTDNQTVNPGPILTQNEKLKIYEGELSIDEASTTFQKMFQKNKTNSFLFNSDSNILLNDFATNNSQSIIAYNGDLFYAMQGGDTYSSTDELFKEWLLNHFNTSGDLTLNALRPKATLSVMDCMVINKKRAQEKNHVNEAYSVIKKIALEGSDSSLYTDDSKTAYNEDDPIFQTNNFDEYINGPMQNFDYVNYTSPLLTLNAYVLNSQSNQSNNSNIDDAISTTIQSGYLTDAYSWINEVEDPENGFLTEDQYQKYINLLTKIYSVSDANNINFLTVSLSDLVKDNTAWAWFYVKNNL